LSKGPKTTTWIWNLHSDAHDFDTQYSKTTSHLNIGRQVLSSNLAHISLVFFWLGGMLFHGAYLSNYSAWLKDPKNCVASAQMVWSLVGQHILNSDVGGYFQGIHITSGLFSLWCSQGIMCQLHLKYGCAASLLGTIVSLAASYIQIQLYALGTGFYKKFKTILVHHIAILFGLGSISWSGHQVHIAYPLNRLLDSGIDPAVMPSPQDLLSYDLVVGLMSTESVAAHHLYLGIVFIASGLLASRLGTLKDLSSYRIADLANSWHGQLSINLGFTASLSAIYSHHVYALPV